ncbi:MAG: glycosyltransferase family 2 protein [Acidimicrobiales bacterium]
MTEPHEVGSRVSAAVVNYNAATHLAACLDSLQAAGVRDVVVVDNGSSDGSRAVVDSRPLVEWLETGSNLGYGRAANLGGARRTAEFLLVCNADIVVEPRAVAAMVRRMGSDPGLAIVGPRVLNPDGTLYPSVRTFPDLLDAVGHGLLGVVAPSNRFTRRYRLLDWDHETPQRADWVSGACFLARRTAWAELGGFDPRYFMYLEDVDLCWRAGRAGWGVAYEPAAEVLHVQGVSAAQHPYRMLVAHHRSMWRFAAETSTGVRRLTLPLIGAGLLLRLGAAMASHRLVRPVRDQLRSRVP